MATRNSGRSDDRSSGRGSSANAGGSSGQREGGASASSGGSRQNSGGANDTSRRATSASAGSNEGARRGGSSSGTASSGLDPNASSANSNVNSGIAGIGGSGTNASNVGAGPESRGGTAGTSQSSGNIGSSTSRGDQERQLRTAREEGRSGGSRGTMGEPQQQQGRQFASSGYLGGSSPFAMMRRMMDDMDRLFSDFGFVQPGLLASSLFGPDVWSQLDQSRALGSGQSGSSGQQRALSGQGGGSQQGLQRSGPSGLQGWQHGGGLWSPQVEVRERGNNIVVRADLPGLSRDDVDVEVDNDALIIRGERHNDWEDEQEGLYRSERSYGSFYRAIPLPDGVDPNACNATFKDGVLEVTLPKPQQAQSKGRKIQVK